MRSVLFLYNSFSGKSKIKKKKDYIINSLKESYDVVDEFGSIVLGDITDFIKLNGSSYDTIVVAGGDGTIHEVVNAVMSLDVKPTLAFIPAGTCNDAARTLGYSKNINKCLKIIKANHHAAMDVSRVNDNYFIYVFAAGTLTEISYAAPQKTKRHFGKMAYYGYVFKILQKTISLDMEIKTEDTEETGKYSLFLASNSRFIGGFFLKRKYRLALDDGKLQLILIDKRSTLSNILLCARLLVFGQFKSKRIKFIDTKNITLKTKEPIDFNTDGEKMTLSASKEINVSVINKAINVIGSKKIIEKYFN